MIIRNRFFSVIHQNMFRLTISGLLYFSVSCSPDMQDDAIPFVPFSPIVLNLNLPTYVALRSDGGHVSIDGGVRGIILYRKSASEYLAFEQNCSYQPNNACAQVMVNASHLYMEDACCGSTFNFSNGSPSGGPAWRPLRQYRTSSVGSELSITDDIIE
jgi:nitrite reductase/ring-hydroxylating ferredoxin subunit